MTGRWRSGATRGLPAHQDRRRRETRRRRRRLLLGTAILWVPLTFVGCDLTITPGLGRDGIEEYRAGELDEAVDTFDSMDGFNLVERWKAPFNLGTSLTRRGGPWDHWDAVDALDRALEEAPDDAYCLVQRNRAIAYEFAGDAEMAYSAERAGWAEEARAVEEAGEEPPDDAPWAYQSADEHEADAEMFAGTAAWLYEDALAARTDPACPPPSSPQEQQQEEQAAERLGDKQQQAAEAAGQEPEQTEPEPASAEERQAEVERRNAEAAAAAEAQRQQQAAQQQGDGEGDDDGSGGSGGGTRGW